MIVLNAILLVLSFICMEGVAWFTHRYIMHGFLWSLHRDHHLPDKSRFFQRNDIFFIFFAIPGMLLIHFGRQAGLLDPRLWVGIGITLYGLSYAIVHDILIHHRLKFFPKIGYRYINALRRAHGLHHRTVQKDGAECFGMLWVPRSVREDIRRREKKQ